MSEMKSAELRLPVQVAVDRTATHATLAGGSGLEASQFPDFLQSIPWGAIAQAVAQGIGALF
jgi:hypothetical protein